VLATEIYAVACRNAEIGALTRANTAELMRIVSTAMGVEERLGWLRKTTE